MPKEEIDWTMRKQAKAPRRMTFWRSHGDRFFVCPLLSKGVGPRGVVLSRGLGFRNQSRGRLHAVRA